jgi:hypothetical protein
MGLECKICHQQITAFSGVRCKNCRLLVCENCSEKQPDGSGALCDECRKRGVKLGGEEKEERQEVAKPDMWQVGLRRFMRGLWKFSDWLEALKKSWRVTIIGVFFSLIFIGFAFYPLIRAKSAVKKLITVPEDRVEEAYEEIMNIQGRALISELRKGVLEGDKIARLRCIRALGDLGDIDSIPILKGVRDDPQEDPLIRDIAREAMVQIENF